MESGARDGRRRLSAVHVRGAGSEMATLLSVSITSFHGLDGTEGYASPHDERFTLVLCVSVPESAALPWE